MESMVILQLKISNIGPIKECDITFPSSGIIEVSGKNETGKTHVLQAIRYLLGGLPRGEESLLRLGETKGEIIAYLGDGENGLQIVDGKSGYKYKLRRVFTENGTKVSVESPDGATYKSPQGLLNQFLSDLAFDPLEFIKLDEREQVNRLLKVIKVPFDREEFSTIAGYSANGNDPITTINAAYNYVFDERREINRDLEKARGALDSIIIPDEVEKLEPVSLSELVTERQRLVDLDGKNIAEREHLKTLQDAIKVNLDTRIMQAEDFEKYKAIQERGIEKLRKEIENIENEIKSNEERLQNTIAYLQNQHEALVKQSENQTDIVNSLPVIDFTEIDTKIAKADEDNKKAQESAQAEQFRQAKLNEQQTKADEVADLERDSRTLTDRLKAILDYKTNLLQKVQFPIAGLSFDNENRVIYDGIPLKKRGQSIQLIISCAITAALKPNLKVILSPQETQLDNEHKAKFEAWAQENGFQVLTCKVVEQREEGTRFYIEDGVIN